MPNISLCILPDGEADQSVSIEDIFNSSSAKDYFGLEEIEISDITLYGSSATETETVITIVVVVACVLVFGGLITFLVIRRKKKMQKKSAPKARDEE